VTERTVLADWIFTTPAVIVQPLTGLALVYLAGYPLWNGWVLYAVLLYIVAGCCWLPVVVLQIRMRNLRAAPIGIRPRCQRNIGNMHGHGSG